MTKLVDRVSQPEATEFILRKLSAFDLSLLERLTLAANLTTTVLSWRLKKPVRSDDGTTYKSQYQVSASLRREETGDGEKVSIPLLSQHLPPFTPALSVTIATRADKLVFAAACGCYLFLRRTKQVPGMAASWMARRYAIGWLGEFAGRTALTATLAPNGQPAVPLDVAFNCFGVAIPAIFVAPATKKSGLVGDRYFNYAIGTQTSASDDGPPLGPPRQAVAQAVRRTFADCDAAIVDEVCHADEPSVAWLVLADWLDERGDDRARWIRSHRLDLSQLWNHSASRIQLPVDSATVSAT